MIASHVKRGMMAKWGLGKHQPPTGLGLPKDIELVWNQDAARWEIYKLAHKGAVPDDDILDWQMSAPQKGLPVTPGISTWLAKYDTTEGGNLSLKDRQDRWIQHFKDSNDREDKMRDDIRANASLEIGRMSKYLSHYETSFDGGKKHRIVAPITVGYNKKTGKAIRAYPKVKKEIDV